MSCSGIRCRNKGSGYTKETVGNTELETRMKDLLAARAADDTKIWGPVSVVPQPKQEALPSNNRQHG
jgi:hypothetical protein